MVLLSGDEIGTLKRVSIADLKQYNSPIFLGGGGGGDLTIEEWSLDAYHELVPVDLKALKSSMFLLGFALIWSFSIMYLSLPILLL